LPGSFGVTAVGVDSREQLEHPLRAGFALQGPLEIDARALDVSTHRAQEATVAQ
jgi:hypothetical protein